MNIIIAGAGKVGFNLAKTLSIGHNVTIIDKNEEALHRIQESLDILPLKGDVEDSKTYEVFKDTPTDLFIAVTNIDNVNLIATMIAKTVIDIKRTFVRLQKHFKDVFIIKEKLGVDEIIFPVRLASKGVASLLHYPKANNVKFFKYTKHQLISIRVSDDFTASKLDNDGFIKVGIERDKDFFIPDDDTVVQPNDLVYFFGLQDKIREICNSLDGKNNDIQKCVVFGGEDLGISISKALIDMNREVKLVEKDMLMCENANLELGGRVDIVNAKYSSHELFEEENLDHADMFVAATNNDEFNIIKSLEAKERGVKKIVAINNDMEYYNLMHSLGIIVVRGPKVSAYNKIMEEISTTNVVIQKWFCGSKAVVFMRKIFTNSKLCNKTIKFPNAQDIKSYYIRNQEIYKIDKKVILEEDDVIVCFSIAKKSALLKRWIYEL